MAYNKEKDKDRNYQAEIDDAVNRGDYNTASQLERDRNEKIDSEGSEFAKTYKYQAPSGVDVNAWGKSQSSFKPSSDVGKADSDRDLARGDVENLMSPNGIVSSGTWNALDTEFQVPEAVTEADAWLSGQLQKIQSGKTSYSDQVRDMMDKIMNREKFSYDVDKDPLFQQALASSMGSGQQAMQNTIGQASALTGGYGSTYATTAGNQAYNAFIEDAYDNLPQYYQMALDAYNMEGEEMYRQFGMVSELDDKEYNRNLTAFDATRQYRNQAYNEAYALHRDSVSDAYAKANLEISEHGQLMSDAVNHYNVTSDYADTLYAREFEKWNAEVGQAMQAVQMQHSDYWEKTKFDQEVQWHDEEARLREEEMMYNRIKDLLAYEQSERFHKDEMDYSYAALKTKGSGGGGGSSGSGSRASTFTPEKLEQILLRPNVNLFASSLYTPGEFKRTRDKNGTYTISLKVLDGKGNPKKDKDGKLIKETKRFESWGDYVAYKIETAFNNDILTDDEAEALLQKYFL